MKIGIVGAGWAGLSAAFRLRQSGHHVTVFEASETPGGRARRVIDAEIGTIDNGQHLMLGAYTETLDLIQSLNPSIPTSRLLRRSALHLESLDRRFSLSAGNLPSPLRLLMAMLLAKGLSLADKWRAISMLTRIKYRGWRCQPEWSVEQLLAKYGQPPTTCRWLWHPLCIAAMNTPVGEASAQVFLNLLKDSFDAEADHSDLIVPRTDLSALWPDAATIDLDMRWRHVVRRVLVGNPSIDIDGECFDHVIVAVPPYAAARILALKENISSASHTMENLRQALSSFTYVPITNITLRLVHAGDIRGQMWMLDEQPSKGHYGQWVFFHENGQEIRVVISAPSDSVLEMDHATLAHSIDDQIRVQLGQSGLSVNPLPGLAHFRVVTEKRATFACTPTLQRPDNQTPWPNLLLAGDWTHGPYPAVLEAAVRSGKRAAELTLFNPADDASRKN